LVEAGHDVTLLTRGKKEITYQIPDDTDESYIAYKSAVKHIAADRKDKSMLDEKLAGKKFDGNPFPVQNFSWVRFAELSSVVAGCLSYQRFAHCMFPRW
jgi:hypothetical protein